MLWESHAFRVIQIKNLVLVMLLHQNQWRKIYLTPHKAILAHPQQKKTEDIFATENSDILYLNSLEFNLEETIQSEHLQLPSVDS